MNPIIICAFNMDTVCVELRFLDGAITANILSNTLFS